MNDKVNEALESLKTIETVTEMIGRRLDDIAIKLPNKYYEEISLYGCNLLDLEQENDTIKRVLQAQTQRIKELENDKIKNNSYALCYFDFEILTKNLLSKDVEDIQLALEFIIQINDIEFNNELSLYLLQRSRRK